MRKLYFFTACLALMLFANWLSAQWVQMCPGLKVTGNMNSLQKGAIMAYSPDGNTAALSYAIDTSGYGGVYIFRKNGNVLVQQGTIKANWSPGTISTSFSGMALSANGNILAMSNVGLSLPGYSCLDTLAVYEYINGTWNKQCALKVGRISKAQSPYQVAMSYSGNRIVTGGRVYLRSGNTWVLEKILHPGDRTGLGSQNVCDSNYAFSCASNAAISADGNTIAISDVYYPDSTTCAWVFVYNGTDWVQQGPRLEGTGNHGYTYQTGAAPVVLSGDGNTLAIGISFTGQGNKVWVFTRNSNIWTEQITTANHLGTYYTGSTRLSLSYDGNVLLKGIDRQIGFCLCKRNGATWTSDERLYKATPQDYYEQTFISQSGPSNVVIDSSGTQALVASDAFGLLLGGAWYFTASADSFIQNTPKLFTYGPIGHTNGNLALAMSADGSTMAVGDFYDNGGEGAVWLFTRSGSSWSLLGSKKVLSTYRLGHGFGNAVALSANGSVLAVGASHCNFTADYSDGRGNVYVFDRAGNNYVQRGDSITRSINGHNFPYQLRISQDGNTVLGRSIDSGAAVFYWNGSNWTEQGTFLLGTNWSDDMALSGDGNTAAIGVNNDLNLKGDFYVFVRNGSTWSQQGPALRPASITQNSYFPSGLGISYNGNEIAAAHSNLFIYHRSGTNWLYPDSVHVPALLGPSVVSNYGDSVASVQLHYAYSMNGMGVYVYANNGTQWQLTPSVINSIYPNSQYNNYTKTDFAASSGLNYVAFVYYNNPYSTEVKVYRNMSMVDTLALLQNASCNQTANGKITVNVSGSGPFTFKWSSGLPNTGVQTGLLPGTYNLTLSDAVGDTVTRQYTIGINEQSIANVSNSTTWSCATGTGNAVINVTGGTGPFTYVWNTTQTTSSLSGVTAGDYTYTVTDSLGCLYTDTAHVTALVYSVVAGSTGAVCGNSGSATVNMFGTPPYNYVWSTGATTQSIASAGGNYTVTVTDANSCTGSVAVAVNAYCNNFITGRVYFDRNNNCLQDGAEPGVDYLTMTANNGSGALFGSTNGNGDYLITVPDSGDYNVTIAHWQQCAYPVCTGSSYPAVATLHGLGDTATGVNFALVNPGIDLTLTSQASGLLPGTNFNYTVYYGNLQDSVIPTGTLTIVYDPLATLVSSTPNYTSINQASHTITYDLSQIGLLYSFSQSVQLVFSIPNTVIPHTQLLMSATILPTTSDCNPANNTVVSPLQVGGSLDPNYKIAYPENTIPITDSLLTYTIHFQNIGSDSTLFIEVRDTLGPYVDPASVVTVSASHKPYTFNISGSGILSWMFNPLALPDSATDPAGSQGYVTFTVKTKPGLALGTAIQNTASIYFDYNAAVVTNTVTNVVNNPLGITTISNHSFAMQLYPNPANSLVNVEVPVLAIGGQLQLTDVTGRLIAQQSINATLLQLNTSAMASGMYFVKAITSSGQSAVCKLVIEK